MSLSESNEASNDKKNSTDRFSRSLQEELRRGPLVEEIRARKFEFSAKLWRRVFEELENEFGTFKIFDH